MNKGMRSFIYWKLMYISYCPDDHFVIHIHSLCFIPKTNILLYVNYTSIQGGKKNVTSFKNQKKQKIDSLTDFRIVDLSEVTNSPQLLYWVIILEDKKDIFFVLSAIGCLAIWTMGLTHFGEKIFCIFQYLPKIEICIPYSPSSLALFFSSEMPFSIFLIYKNPIHSFGANLAPTPSMEVKH